MRTATWDSRIPARVVTTVISLLFIAAVVYQVVEYDEEVLPVGQYVQLSEIRLEQADTHEAKNTWERTLPPHRVSAYHNEQPGRFLVTAYADPTADGVVPLRWIEERRNERISPHLTLGDFAARDGAPMARIDQRLVEALEAIIEASSADLRIISGYRHPLRNMHPLVNGSSHSQHMAGRAADIASSSHSPLELADAALKHVGCTVGLGLGSRSLHVDVRGKLSLWTYEGAELEEDEFTEWARRMYCPDSTIADSVRASSRYSLADYMEILTPEVSAFHLTQVTQGRLGAVMLQITDDDSTAIRDAFQLSFIPAESTLSTAYGLSPLLSAVGLSPDYVVYVAVGSGGDVEKGVTRTVLR